MVGIIGCKTVGRLFRGDEIDRGWMDDMHMYSSSSSCSCGLSSLFTAVLFLGES